MPIVLKSIDNYVLLKGSSIPSNQIDEIIQFITRKQEVVGNLNITVEKNFFNCNSTLRRFEQCLENKATVSII
jgi:hypothetical protein